MSTVPADDYVLEVDDLRIWYHTGPTPVRAVDGVSFGLRAGERFGLAGESGSGKSTIATALMGLVRPPGRIESGSIQLAGRDLAHADEETMRQLRLAEIAIVPQGAMNSLNPVRRIRDHFKDNINAHERDANATRVRERMTRLLAMVGLDADTADRYPHELSGGMKQRVCIALAITLSPKVIVADEPTSALDVVVQRQVVQTLRTVQAELGAAVLLVGHDMALLAQFVDRLGVMYAGRLVELASVEDVFADPVHPYTRMLISSLPTLDDVEVPDQATANGSARLWLPSSEVALREVSPGHWVLPFDESQQSQESQ